MAMVRLARSFPQYPQHNAVTAGAAGLCFATYMRLPSPVLYTKDWAYAPYGSKGNTELYAIREDPYAEHNVAAEHGDVVRSLHTRILDWLRDINAPEEALAAFEPETRNLS